MKKLFRYLNIATLFIALAAVFASCSDKDDSGDGNLGLNIKVFAPTVVVPGFPMTVNGSGFGDVTEIVFPGDITVKDFEIVTNEMIRVKAPEGLSQSGKIMVRNSAGETAESRLPLTIGKTVVTGYSSQEGDTIKGKSAFTIYGRDMQFVQAMEFVDEDDAPVVIPASEFIRVATGRVVAQVPAKVKEDFGKVKIHISGGQIVESPTFYFEPSAGGGHWEYQKVFMWENTDRMPVASWPNKFRFCQEGKDYNNECLAEFDEESWNMLKEGEVYLLYESTEFTNVRITTGWWSSDFGGKEHNNHEEATTDDETGYNIISINIKEEKSLYDLIDDQHFLITGDAYTPIGIYYIQPVWVEGDGHFETVRETLWKNDTGLDVTSWTNKFRFCPDGKDYNNECIATLPEDVWTKCMTEPIRLAIEQVGDAAPNVRITTGWWSTDFGGKEYNWYQVKEDAEDGKMFIEFNLASDPDFVATVQEQHLLFTGDNYRIVEIYQEKEVWVEGDGDGAGPKPIVLWENKNNVELEGWKGTFRFANVENNTDETIHAFTMDEWSIIKDGEFYFLYEPIENANVRITTGWWQADYGGKEFNCAEFATDDPETGMKVIKLSMKDYPDVYDRLDEQHLLFTGDGYKPLKLYYYAK